MKYFLFCLLFGASFVSKAGVNKRVPPFLVISSEKDPKLKSTEAVFEFEVINPGLRGTEQQIQSAYNGIAHNFTPDKTGKHELKVEPGIYAFQFYTAPSPVIHTGETDESGYFEIYSDSVRILPGHRTVVQLRFEKAGQMIISDKPVIYLYPPADLEITATVKPAGKFTFTYPDYSAGWKGTAHPDGSTTIAGHTYPYLFWEAESRLNIAEIDFSTGFIVPAENTASFLGEKLSQMGLSDREKTDFITYWGPKMISGAPNFVQFLFDDDCDRFAELAIDPAPRQLFRVYMIWAPMPERDGFDPKPQQLPAVDRTHFYAIEWGGSQFVFPQTLSFVD